MRIELEKVCLKYPTGKQALNEITFSLGNSGMIGLLGPNGAGKSTLIKLLTMGLLPSSGTISTNGIPLQKCETKWKSQLGYLPQKFGLYDELTVWQFLDYMAALKGVLLPKAAIAQVLEEVNLTGLKRARIRTLSGGQRQRVGIAQALLGTPNFLIFDEPTVGLDPEERIHFRNLFSKIAGERLVLLSTHIIEDIQSVCERLIVIRNGNILFIGTPAELILAAKGHVGVLAQTTEHFSETFQITARVNTMQGVFCRGVAQELPALATPVEPTLEDAYLYLIGQEENAE